MRIKAFPLLFLIVCFVACKDDINNYQSLNEGWQFSLTDSIDWVPATVPGSVQTDLLNLHKIPHPFKGNNEDSIQWVSEKNWQYKKLFTVSEELLIKQKHFLKLEGLDTYASVFLNDSLILSANNAFRSWEVDISDVIQLENELLIKFLSTDSIETIEASKLDYELPEAPRVFTRKPQFQYGWDWGPTIKTLGIWKDVSLISYDAMRLKEVFLQTESITDTLAKLRAHLTINAQEYSEVIIEVVNNTSKEVTEIPLKISNDQSEYSFPLTIKNPKLWWTHNLGEPFLYNFEIRLKHQRSVVDKISKKVGVRTIELVNEKDSLGESFYFKLNQHPVYMKGANSIPQNIFLSEVNSQDHNRLLSDVVDANMNMLRVWGGGIYEADEFYDLCDEKGILVWQDFMFACAMYPGDANFIENVKQEAIENVKRLRQHPSIALWCGNNENSEGWFRWGWQDGKTDAQKEKIWRDYHSVFRHVLPKVLDSLHPSIDYWESSPKYGRGDKRFKSEGDAHDWWVWHDGYPFEHFEEEVPRFMSEFGFQSFPSYESIKYFTELDSIDISHSSFASHQKHPRGFKLIKEYMERDFPVPQNDEDYVYVSQLLQAHGITKGVEAHRRAKPYNMGTLYWQLNDCWPVVSWSSIDGLGNWKALHYKVKRSFENVLISTVRENDSLKVYLVNDNLTDIERPLRASWMDFYGSVFDEFEARIKIPANSSELVFAQPLNEEIFNYKDVVLKIEFGETNALHYFAKPKDLNLIRSEIFSEISKNENGFLVTLSAKSLHKDVFLFSSEKGKWSDNFFDLIPGEEKVVQFTTQAKKLNFEMKSLNQFTTNVTSL